MQTSSPLYDGSLTTSSYPVIAVLKTTSPTASPIAPNARPRNTRPSANASIASRPLLIAPLFLPPVENYFARNDSQDRPSLQPHICERSVTALRPEFFRRDSPLEIGIDHGDVRDRSLCQRSGLQSQQRRRIQRHHLN